MIKNDKNLLVGLDLGTSFLKLIVGKINEDNEIDFIGIVKSKSLGIKRGVVIDINATVVSIEKTVEDAEELLDINIDSLYVNISGKHIHSFNVTGRAAISDHKEVTLQDLKSVEESAKAITLPSDQEILHVISKDYEIDGQDGIKAPIGMSGIAIDGRYHLVTGAKNARDNLEKCIRKCTIEPQAVVLDQLASSMAVLTEDEKELGVCLIDIGGGTTDILIYINGVVEYTTSLSLGGDQVTNDLAQGLKTSTSNAEELKITNGCVNIGLSENDYIEVPSVGERPPRRIQRSVLANIMYSRYEEIFKFINERIENGGFGEKISAGVVITGGSAKVEGIEDLAEEVFHRPSRLGIPLYINGISLSSFNTPEYAASVGLLLYAKNQRKYQAEISKDSFFSVVKKIFSKIFFN